VVAGIALIEHRSAIPLRSAFVESGGRLLADAWIHPVDQVEVGVLPAEPAVAWSAGEKAVGALTLMQVRHVLDFSDSIWWARDSFGATSN